MFVGIELSARLSAGKASLPLWPQRGDGHPSASLRAGLSVQQSAHLTARGARDSYRGIAFRGVSKTLQDEFAFYRLRKNSGSIGFWEGHDFSRAAKSFRIARALAPEVCFLRLDEFFRSLFRRWISEFKLHHRLQVTPSEVERLVFRAPCGSKRTSFTLDATATMYLPVSMTLGGFVWWDRLRATVLKVRTCRYKLPTCPCSRQGHVGAVP